MYRNFSFPSRNQVLRLGLLLIVLLPVVLTPVLLLRRTTLAKAEAAPEIVEEPPYIPPRVAQPYYADGRWLLPELISMAVQLEFIRRGAAQQELLGQLANRIAADYIASAEQRAEKIGAELVIPMVLFYFLPFTVAMLAIIGWPIVEGMFI